MSAWLWETKSWLYSGSGLPVDPYVDMRENAHSLMEDLNHFCKEDGAFDQSNHGLGIMLTHTRWHTSMYEKHVSMLARNKKACFDIQHIMEREDKLGGVEQMCILQLTATTLISSYGKKARVLRAYADIPTRCIRIRKSHILDFDDICSFMTDDWKRLLCWVLAEPRTDASTLSKQA